MINAFFNPALLFFLSGIIIGSIFTKLKPSNFISRYLGYYLLMSLGLKGGFSLQKTGFISEVTSVLSLGVIFALFIPFCSYLYLKNILNTDDAAALAGTYGSVSAITFVTANTYLSSSDQLFDNYMSAVLVVMEFPAIFMALFLVNQNSNKTMRGNLDTIKSTFLELPNIILLTSLLTGFYLRTDISLLYEFLTIEIFEYVLILFLFLMGLGVSNRISELSGKGSKLILFALVMPITGSGLALITSYYADLSVGNATLLMVLTASSSYIAVPAVVKDAIPNANPAIYLGLSLGITFPFNVILGIPIYNQLAIYFLN